MYKVLIADDEASVMEALENSLSWNEMDMEIVYYAKNGKEALAAAESNDIDIAILDIRMPGMNGLEICAALRQRKENIQLIIISGYAEFSYAERAMEYGVLGYCLKPLDYEKLKKLLVKAQAAIKKSQGVDLNPDLMDAVEAGDEKKICEILAGCGLDSKQIYVSVSIGNLEKELSCQKIVLQIGRDQYGYLTDRLVAPDIRLSDQKPEIQGIGYEEEPISVFQIKDALFRCRVRAYQFFITGKPICCGSGNGEDAGAILNSFAEDIKRGNWDAICRRLQGMSAELQNKFDITSCVRLNNLIFSSSLFRDADTDYYIYDFHQLVSEYGNFQQMAEKLAEFVKGAGDLGNNEEYSNASFMKLLSYIEENYRSDISLTSAASELHMNPNYVSRMFKKEAGITFIHYIIQMRIEEAVRLLTTTNRSIVDIAMEVGFNDYFYFLKTFKKFMHKTPSQYRGE